nr:PE-PPE domain-containing protein [Mycolicibacter nonchromogenicus]
MTLPLRFAGVPDNLVDQLDAFLQPQVDAGYSRNDDPATRPISVSPTGMDVAQILGPETNSAVDDTVAKLRDFFGFTG